MELAGIRQYTEQVAEVVHLTLDADVVVVDDHLERIADTFKYQFQQAAIRVGSIVGSIIVTGKPLVIEDKKSAEACLGCQNYQACSMESIIGVPIRLNGGVVGALALIPSHKRMRKLVEDIGSTLGFLEKIADLLAGRMEAGDLRASLTEAEAERDALLGSVSDAAAMLDETGVVRRCNRRFASCFPDNGPVIGKYAGIVLGRDFARAFSEGNGEISGVHVYASGKGESFNFLCTSRRMVCGGKTDGYVIFLRDIGNCGERDASSETWADGYFLDSLFGISPQMMEARHRMRSLMESGKSALLIGASKMRLRDLAHQIYHNSKSSKRCCFDIDCGANDQELEAELFGDEKGAWGKLSMAQGGTVCLESVDQMPLYLQERFEKTLGEYASDDGVPPSVRVLALTTRNLKKQAESGMFLETLCRRLCSAAVYLPNITDDREDVRFFFTRCFSFYREKYGRPELQLDEDAMTELCGLPWPEDVVRMERAVEYLIVNSGGDRISRTDVHSLPMQLPKKSVFKSPEEVNRDAILELIKQGKCRDEIAQTVGISRATLFRWLKKYETT